MRRAGALLIATFALLLTGLSASAARTLLPRGVLTRTEFRELRATDVAMRHAGRTRGTPTHVARLTCRALTNATNLTAAERAECEASLIFSYRFFAFPYQVSHCAKVATRSARIRCLLGATDTFERAVRAFIRTNAASAKAVAPRHFTRRCLDYLLFTTQQARTTTALAGGLQRYARAIRSGNVNEITSAGNRLDSELVASRQAMSFSTSVDACRHR